MVYHEGMDPRTAGLQQAGAARPTRWELATDAVIHAGGIVAGLIGVAALLAIAVALGKPGALAACVIYSVGLLAMLSCSAAYNLVRSNRWRETLRRYDQSAIFAMIAGSYTPITALHLAPHWAAGLTALIWSVAALSIGLRLFWPQIFERVSLLLYLGLGWAGLIALGPLFEALDASIMALLLIGGALYTIGVAFHVWERLPFQNAIWHAFVVAAASVHYAAIVGSVAATA